MNHLHTRTFGHMAIAIGVIALFTITGLWSWNTLSEVFHFPQAQFRHAVAAMTLLLIVGWTLRRSRRHHYWEYHRNK